VTELCQLDVDDIDLIKARFYIDDAKTPAGAATSPFIPGSMTS
jgi:hypothetical protein